MVVDSKSVRANKSISTTCSTYMYVENIGSFFNDVFGYKYPLTWGGFNLSMTKIPDMPDKYICVTRVVYTPEMANEKIVVGTNPANRADHMRPHDYTRFFMWSNWSFATELSVLFVGNFDSEKGFTVDKRYKPLLINTCFSNFQKPPCMFSKQTGNLGIDMLLYASFRMRCTDFRLFTVGDCIIIQDTHATSLKKVLIHHKNKTIRIERWVDQVCKLPDKFSPNTIKNALRDGAPYYKFFDKNWSYIGKFKDKLMFLDWFYSDGVYTVLFDQETASCARKRIVNFKKDIIPKDGSPAFSVGSTTLQLNKSKNIDVLGVGHVKFVWDDVLLRRSKLDKEVMRIDKLFKDTFANMYRRHVKYVYASFFFRITENADGKFKMTMSDLWIPFMKAEKKRFHTLVTFPMSVWDDNEKVHVSGGASDMYNMVYTFDKQSVLKRLVHDASQFEQDKLKLGLITLETSQRR